MSIEELNKAFNLIERNNSDFAEEKSISLIDEAEKALNVKFPLTYVEFLKKYGCGDIEGVEIFGIINNNFENSGVPDAIWLTLKHRKLGLPNELVIIYATGDGTYYALDTSNFNNQNECPVVSYFTDGSMEKVANSFGSFLLKELQMILP